MKRSLFVLTILVSLACLGIDPKWLSAMQTREPKLPPTTMKLIRLKGLRLGRVKRVKGGGLTAIFVPTGIQPAQISVTCGGEGGKSYSISTGNNKGTCKVTTKDEGKTITGATCSDTSDGGNNGASVDCSLGGGDGSCTGTSGSGECN